ncbi:sensor histidine kinase [Kiloniella sp. b19]|uniref:sensor histidine kinase n=1 Tax=Kiloniella sp. GXU_MW_B19 TaxID=3141326 RepID=UPI0031D865FC
MTHSSSSDHRFLKAVTQLVDTPVIQREKIYQSAALALAEGTGYRYTGTATVLPNENQVYVQSFWDGEEMGKGLIYALENTPCDIVYKSCEYYCHTKNLIEDFPEDLLLADMNLKSYHSMGIQNKSGKVIGHVFALHDQDVGEDENFEDLFKLVAHWCAIQFENEELISRLKDSESKALEAQNVAERASRAKSSFLAHISHELRTPLNAIIGFSELLEQEIYGSLGNERYKSYAEDIVSSGKHLLSLINDILEISKLEVDETNLNESIFSVQETMNQAFTLIQTESIKKQLQTEQFFPDGDIVIEGDNRAFLKIITNILENSIKYTDDGGCLIGRAALNQEGNLEIILSDNGCGIAEENLEKVIQPFLSSDNSYSRQESSGIGLGLAIADGLIKLHGGHLKISSQYGEGTVVTIICPKERIQAEALVYSG